MTTGAEAARCSGPHGPCASAPHCPALGMLPSTLGGKAASPGAPKRVSAPLSSCSGPSPDDGTRFLISGLEVWETTGECVCPCLWPRSSDGQGCHSGASGPAAFPMTWDISERRVWMQAQLGAVSCRQLLPLLTLPSLCSNRDLIIANSRRNQWSGACGGCRQTLPTTGWGAIAEWQPTLPRTCPHSSTLAGRWRPGMAERCFLDPLQLLHLCVAAL